MKFCFYNKYPIFSHKYSYQFSAELRNLTFLLKSTENPPNISIPPTSQSGHMPQLDNFHMMQPGLLLPDLTIGKLPSPFLLSTTSIHHRRYIFQYKIPYQKTYPPHYHLWQYPRYSSITIFTHFFRTMNFAFSCSLECPPALPYFLAAPFLAPFWNQ